MNGIDAKFGEDCGSLCTSAARPSVEDNQRLKVVSGTPRWVTTSAVVKMGVVNLPSVTIRSASQPLTAA